MNLENHKSNGLIKRPGTHVAVTAPPATTKRARAGRPSKSNLHSKQPQGVATPVCADQSQITSVLARVDVGFGNALFIRGQGDGLNWDKGIPLACVDHSTWIWSTESAKQPVEFKLLLNDELWAQGENLAVAAGEHLEVLPVF